MPHSICAVSRQSRATRRVRHDERLIRCLVDTPRSLPSTGDETVGMATARLDDRGVAAGLCGPRGPVVGLSQGQLAQLREELVEAIK
jgi:hypothetical protein